MFDRRRFKIESLKRQIEYLETLQERHFTWVSDADADETKRRHLEIAGMLSEVRKHYSALLDLYSKQTP